MKKLSIGDVARRAGIAASAIRFYESEGLLPDAARVAGRRVYDGSILDRLTFIELAKRSGFTVAEIRQLLHGFALETAPGVRWRALAERKLAELEERIAEAERMKAVLEVLTTCECPTLDDCARSARDDTPLCRPPCP